MAGKPNSTSLFHKAFSAVRNDPQKAGILTVLVAILVVLQVRLQMSEKGGPSVARAAAGGKGAGGAVLSSGKSALGGLSAGSSASSSSSPTKPADAAAAMRAWMEQPRASIQRNVFAVDLQRFPQVAGRAPEAVVVRRTETFWDDLAKSVVARADVRKERQVLMENLAQQASQLRLQSTVMGASPKAVVNGELVGVGDVVACGPAEGRVTFRVLKIEARRIVIEREGIKLEIQMK